MVPSYYHVEGATALIFSPDGEKVLLVWERGSWCTPGGAISGGESQLSGLRREVHEECGITLEEDDKSVAYLGGWSVSLARDNYSNDNLSMFAVRATSEDLKVDQKEISEARWFEWRPLLDTWRGQGRQNDRKIEMDLGLPKDRNKIAGSVARGLDVHEAGHGLLVASKTQMKASKTEHKVSWGSLVYDMGQSWS